MKKLLISTGMIGALSVLPLAAYGQTTQTEPPAAGAQQPTGTDATTDIHADISTQVREIEGLGQVSDVEVVEVGTEATAMGGTGGADTTGSADVTGSTGATAGGYGTEDTAELHSAIRANSELESALDDEGVEIDDIVAVEIEGDVVTVFVHRS